ncbi:hypothetical protein CYMTET_15653 [Cymbomonas tetramitiformis]|uniref:Uncharacterized protein n=1 Tax=Cymbomonas tetramitiformis TaxID=36881 RepID=A0AAE0GF25_9CHLO|nr:hypothetical protein CYMTET_15653 [Cymbomonas tetramitiformis]
MEALRMVLNDAGTKVDAEDGDGRTSLTVALAGGHESVVAALLEAGAGVNAGSGQRPLHGAAERDTVEVVRKLVEKGAEVDAEDGEGRTALTVALAFGQEGVARALLEAGAGVNAGTGQRPLHGAAKRGTMEVVKEFMEKGVEVDVEDREGCTALTVALAFGQEVWLSGAAGGGGWSEWAWGGGLAPGAAAGAGHGGAGGGGQEKAEVDAEDREGRTALTLALVGVEAARRQCG